jgi:anti-sigma regulatory factor (Ser/Thr protein kinase)
MTAIRTDPQPTPAVMPRRRGGARRALRRAWRECLIPIAARDLTAVGALRGVTRSTLAWWDVPAERRADIDLVLSELVTNALVHTDGPVRVRLTRRGGTVRLDVADTSCAPAHPGAPDLDADAPHGWGLTIAEALADRLTAVDDNTGTGKIISVEFDLR